MFRFLLTTLLIAPFALAQEPGACPRITSLVDVNRAPGVWYLHSRSGTFADGGLKCGRMIWNPPYASNFTLTLRSISTITNEITSVVVEGNANSPTFRHHVPVLGIVDVDFTIFGVDYSRWMIMYHCDSQGNTHNVNYEVFTRQQFPNEAELNRFIAQSFRSQGLQMPPFIMNNQNCQF